MKTSTIAIALPLTILAASSQVAYSETDKEGNGLRGLKKNVNCLKAKMRSSNDYTGDVKGTVKVCFNNPIGTTTGTLEMSVKGLPALIAGGVHIHSGTDCTSSTTQGGHGWKSDTLNSGGPNNNGDAWFNIASSLAPTGAGYSTDENGKGTAFFFYNNGFGYDDTKGQAVVIHGEVGTQVGVMLGDGDYARIACGILQ